MAPGPGHRFTLAAAHFGDPKRKSECDAKGDIQVFDSSVEKLGDGVFAIASGYQDVDCQYGASDAQYGTFFVVSAVAGKYKVAWRVRDSHDRRLAAWANPDSRVWAFNLCKLPGTVEGHPRFYVDAQHTHMAGFTMGGQLSVWEWDGLEARPLLVRDYAFMWAANDGPVQSDRNLLRLRSKENFKTFLTSE